MSINSIVLSSAVKSSAAARHFPQSPQGHRVHHDRAAITWPIASAFGLGGFPGRAQGGPVASGQPYLVGERGPELFVPKLPGTIIPHTGMRGGPTVIINSSPVFQAGMTATDMAAIDSKLAVNNQILRQQVISDMRGGLRNDSDFLGRGA